MDILSAYDALHHYSNRISHVLDELEKSRNLLKQIQLLTEQELKGASAESLQNKLEECSKYLKEVSNDVEIAGSKISALSAMDME